MEAALQKLEPFGGQAVVAHLVEQLNEVGICLPENFVEFDVDRGLLACDLAVEEEWRWIEGGDYRPLFGDGDGRQLVEVADVDDLYAAKWFIVIVADGAEHGVNLVENVGANHAYLVDDQDFQLAHDFAAQIRHLNLFEQILSSLLRRGEGGEGKLEEGVYGHAARIDSGHARGSHHRYLLACVVAQIP